MQKKMVGILAGVAAVHAVLLVSLMVGGGCRQPEILGPHTFNDGPEIAKIPPAVETPAGTQELVVPKVEGAAEVLPPPPAVRPQEVLPVTPVAPVEPAIQKAAVKGGSTYKVKRGDTLSLIAFKHGVSTRELAACNNLSGKAMNIIRPGQVLTIPEGGVYDAKRVPKKRARAVKKTSGKKASPVALPADGIHVVKSGDSLERIGRRYGVSARAIAKENNIALTKVLQINDKLRIPGKAAAAPVAVKPVVEKKQTPVEDTLNVDDLDPQLDMESTSESAAAPAAPATPAAVEESKTAAPAGNTAPVSGQKTESFEIPNDTTLEEFSSQMQVSIEELRRLNPNIPADGKLPGGTYLLLPVVP